MTCTSECRKPSPAQAHCSACHVTFGSVTDFDRHRRAAWSSRRCPHPSTLDLVESGGVWASAERHAKVAALQNARSAARSDAQSHELALAGQ